MSNVYKRAEDLVEKKSNGEAPTTQKESNLYKRIGGLIETGGGMRDAGKGDAKVDDMVSLMKQAEKRAQEKAKEKGASADTLERDKPYRRDPRAAGKATT